LRWSLIGAELGYDVVGQKLLEKILGINEGVYKRLGAVALKDMLKESNVK